MKSDPRNIALFITISFMALILTLTGFSLYYNLQETESQYKLLARESARSLFLEIRTTRRWNARHGGVYLITGKKVKPNPYLKDPLRDLTTKEGINLTKVNPAFMTRLISEVLKREQSTEFHITSLKPINPGNAPDAWEKNALHLFQKGHKEYYSIFTLKGKDFFRYMAPLPTEKSCLVCHAAQGYRAGEIRGGISIMIPYGFYQQSIRSARKRIYTAHAGVITLSILLIISLGSFLIISINRMKEARSQLKVLGGLLPICSNCKKIRDDKGYWKLVESYITQHSEAKFSHSICPDCAQDLYGKDYTDDDESS